VNTEKFMTLSDGSLCAARGPFRIIRSVYSKTFENITNGVELRATIRNGAHASNYGPLFFLMSDGACLCFKCARDNLYHLTHALRHPEFRSDGWRPVACTLTWEGPDDYCAHCGDAIPSVYGDPDAPASGDSDPDNGASRLLEEGSL
jgi:hypothetical protein